MEIETHRVVLNVVARLDGDYNFDGIVDAADYTVWRNAVETGDLSADGDGSTFIDDGDYDVWKANYGRTSEGAGSGGVSLAVPEPASAVGLLVGIVLLVGRRTLT